MEYKVERDYKVECYSYQNYTKFKYDQKGKAKCDVEGSYSRAWVYERLVNVLQAGVAMYGEAFLYPENTELREKLFAMRNEGSSFEVSNVDLGIESVSVTQYNPKTQQYEETEYSVEWAEKFINKKLEEAEME